VDAEKQSKSRAAFADKKLVGVRTLIQARITRTTAM
jgi:hypothetical protein